MNDPDPTQEPEVPEYADSQTHPAGYTILPGYLWTFAQHQAELARASDQLKAWLGEVAKDASIAIHFIEARPKGLTSFRDKALVQEDGAPKYDDPLREIYDCIAARVIVFTPRARDDLAALITNRSVVKERINLGSTKYNGYDSEHLILTGILSAEVLSRHDALTWFFENYSGFEVQIRSVAGHAWAEFEHDNRYKSDAYRALPKESRDQINQWFVEAGGMRRVMDNLFDQIETVLRPNVPSSESESQPLPGPDETVVGDSDTPDEFIGRASLTALIRRRFPGLEVGTEVSVDRLVQRLAVLGITSTTNLEARLSALGIGQVAELMDYPSKTSGARTLDDELLALLSDRYVEAEPDESERDLLRLRLRRVRGKTAIYSIDDGVGSGPLLTAAAAVRSLAKMVAEKEGPEVSLVPNYIAPMEGSLLPSARAQQVATERGRLWVATNLSRLSAEFAMEKLVDRVSTSDVVVRRAGDVLFRSRPHSS